MEGKRAESRGWLECKGREKNEEEDKQRKKETVIRGRQMEV